jgi:hypothetical protein
VSQHHLLSDWLRIKITIDASVNGAVDLRWSTGKNVVMQLVEKQSRAKVPARIKKPVSVKFGEK